jgi:2-hydroxychromene-2-carboxylate isomerase
VKRVDFFYDFACPYAYLGHTQIEALCERAGAELAWRPFLLGGVFRALDVPDSPAAAMPANKARLNALDMMRWANVFGVPLVVPPTHPNRTVLALRAALASGDLPRASKALFRAYWVLGRDVSQPAVVAEALAEAGFDGAALVAAAEAPAIRDELRRRTGEALEAGVFGAPTFIVTVGDAPPQLFWGQDRLVFVEKALSGWAPRIPGWPDVPSSARAREAQS